MRSTTIRVDDDLLAQVEVIARVRGTSVSREIGCAIELLIERYKADAAFLHLVQQALDQEYRLLRSWRSAPVTSPNGSGPAPPPPPEEDEHLLAHGGS
jgi:hypothetical protein